MFVSFLFVFDLLFSLLPSVGKELSPWLFTCAFFYQFSAVLIVGFLFPFGVKGRKWNSIVSVPDHWLFIYFSYLTCETKVLGVIQMTHKLTFNII